MRNITIILLQCNQHSTELQSEQITQNYPAKLYPHIAVCAHVILSILSFLHLVYTRQNTMGTAVMDASAFLTTLVPDLISIFALLT